jgi:predicted DNA-binding transcriptional regulator YafY
MSKAHKILQIINLLNHRRQVTMEAIQRTCDIPERTAYRYLNTISEADVPLYFDRHSRSYSLARTGVLEVDDLSVGEAVMVTVGLKLLAQQVNEDYQEELEKLVTKILVRQQFPVEEIRDIVDHVVASTATSTSFSEKLSSLLIHAAMICKRQVKLTTRSGGNADGAIRVDSPSLVFKERWELKGGEPADAAAAPMDDIRKVTIL